MLACGGGAGTELGKGGSFATFTLRRAALPALVPSCSRRPSCRRRPRRRLQPYGTNDAGGFRNVLPPGENGLDTSPSLRLPRPGALPPHYADQQPLYENLVYAAPTLTDAQVPNFFKDATFGVPRGRSRSTIEPRPGRDDRQRDSAYGVPHIYGDTRADTMFGAGYAGAAGPLFLMDVLRHTGRAELASFSAAPTPRRRRPVGLRPLHRSRPRRAARRRRRSYTAPRAAGRRRRHRLRRRDQRLHRRRRTLDPTLKPAEYTLLGKPMEPWKPTDVIAIASLIGGIFGRGGGNELELGADHAGVRKRIGPRRRGARPGSASAPRTTPRRRPRSRKPLPVRDSQRLRQGGLALPGPGLVTNATATASARRLRRPAPRSRSIGAALARRCDRSRRPRLRTGSWSRPSTRRPATRSA